MLTSITLEAVPGRRSTRSRMLEGARDVTPMVIGVIPFALAIGAAIASSNLSTAQGLISGPAILAGAAQLATIEMLDGGASAAVVALSAMMINARILLYSAALAPWFAGQSLKRRLLLALPVIDQMHFTCTPRFERGGLDVRERIAYYVGAAVFLASAFVGAQAAALVVGASAPESLGLDAAAPLALVGLLAKSTVDRRSIVAATAGALVAVVGVGLPMHSALMVGALAGIVAGDRVGATS